MNALAYNELVMSSTRSTNRTLKIYFMNKLILFSLKNLEDFKLEHEIILRDRLYFDHGAFKGLTRLKRLSITGFNIDSPLESSLFNDLVCLEELNFRDNNLDENTIPNDASYSLDQWFPTVCITSQAILFLNIVGPIRLVITRQFVEIQDKPILF